ncbi:MAG TPA: hypothetical protein VF832_20500 [Longimicrobiales bacterium]
MSSPIDSAGCFFCGSDLPPLDPDRLPDRERLAYDPRLGRLWRVCAQCTRWNVVPLEDRWEVLEQCERVVRDEGDMLLANEHLALYLIAGELASGQLVRVGQPPRLDLADWRYSVRLDEFPVARRRRSWIERLLALPERPVGNIAGQNRGGAYLDMPGGTSRAWIGAPFIEHGALLTAFFSEIPLAEKCPSCGGPFAIEPQRFGDTRLLLAQGKPVVAATCGLCREQGSVPLLEARPTLRAAIAIVERDQRESRLVQAAVHPIDRCGGALPFLERLARRELDIGSMHERERLALWFCLDEQAEAEALEAEWRRAEELESILDDELTEVSGFEDFRERVLAEEEEQE